MALSPACFISSSEFVKLPICQVSLILKRSPVEALSQELGSQKSPLTLGVSSKLQVTHLSKRVGEHFAVQGPSSTHGLWSARPGFQRLVLVPKSVGALVCHQTPLT